MNCQMDAPYVFGAVSGSGCALLTDRSGELARAYVVSQPYERITDPPTALCAGTMFCDLYMPYECGEEKL